MPLMSQKITALKRNLCFFPFQKRFGQGESIFSLQDFFFFLNHVQISCKIKEGLTREFLGSHYKIWTLLDI